VDIGFAVQGGCSLSFLGLIKGNSQLSLLNEAITAGHFQSVLPSPGANVTVFAPTNAAFLQMLSALGAARPPLLSPASLQTVAPSCCSHLALERGVREPCPVHGATRKVERGSGQACPEGRPRKLTGREPDSAQSTARVSVS
jgi:Fasciclin domain